MAFSVGGTLVVGRDEVIRMGPDLTDWLIEERITACPPLPVYHRCCSRAPGRLRLPTGGETLTMLSIPG